MKKLTLFTIFSIINSSSWAEQICTDSIMATTPSIRFIVNSDKTITDTATNLIWKPCSLGQTLDDCSGGSAKTYSWSEALNEIATNHSGWRLPNIKELSSIIELKCVRPSINSNVFPNTTQLYYWSSSPYAGTGHEAWNVFFGSGYQTYTSKTGRNYVRLVRNSSDH